MSIGPAALLPGVLVTFRHRTAEGEHLAPGVLDGHVGKLVPITAGTVTVATARIVSAAVAGDTVAVTYEIDDVYP